jgi:hypothetical protein
MRGTRTGAAPVRRSRDARGGLAPLQGQRTAQARPAPAIFGCGRPRLFRGLSRAGTLNPTGGRPTPRARLASAAPERRSRPSLPGRLRTATPRGRDDGSVGEKRRTGASSLLPRGRGRWMPCV